MTTVPTTEAVLYRAVMDTVPTMEVVLYRAVMATVPYREVVLYTAVLTTVPPEGGSFIQSSNGHCSHHGSSFI